MGFVTIVSANAATSANNPFEIIPNAACIFDVPCKRVLMQQYVASYIIHIDHFILFHRKSVPELIPGEAAFIFLHRCSLHASLPSITQSLQFSNRHLTCPYHPRVSPLPLSPQLPKSLQLHRHPFICLSSPNRFNCPNRRN